MAQLAMPAGRVGMPWYAGLVGASTPLQARKALWGYVFLLPWAIGLIVFWLGPILASFAFSFLQYDMISAPTFVGLDNYIKAFTGDDLFWPSLSRTFTYSLVVVPIGLSGALGNAFGGNSMLIFLAGLQGVPDSLLDAAEIDGAGRWAKFRHVVLPMISPTLLFNLILGIIGALRVFTLAYVATKGGPAYATWFLAYHIYQEAFQYFRMGYGSALAWIFVITLLIFT